MEKFVRLKSSVVLKCHQKKLYILRSNQHTKLEKMPYTNYANIECLVKRSEGCANNPQKSSTVKIGEHIPCGYSMSTI